MRREFENWMIRRDGKSQNTAYQYAISIDKISKHYSEKTNESINIYQIKDILLLESIVKDYSKTGKYSDFGNFGNGTIRNAIVAYLRYFTTKSVGEDLVEDKDYYTPTAENSDTTSEEDQMTYKAPLFSYERDLKSSLVFQAETLFPKYIIYGTDNEGVEYCIEGKRIDLLLERDNELLAIELKAGAADFKVFGQISMYLGLLTKRFPGKTIKGVIIASDIDDSLINACITNDKIRLFTYQMQLSLNEIPVLLNQPPQFDDSSAKCL